MDLLRDQVIGMLRSTGADQAALFERAHAVRLATVGEKTYLRGLIEYSNVCAKDCLYCGIRCNNRLVKRYTLTPDEVATAARVALDRRYGSIVLQAGEITSSQHVDTIEAIIRDVKRLSDGRLGITLSLGEQSEATYRRWFEAGAHRYLLRIEASSKALYEKLHPDDENHLYERRLAALRSLRNAGYQVGTGVMIGLPFQTVEDLADDLLFMKRFDIDMCGMGPYLEHEHTPLYAHAEKLLPITERLELSLKMVAALRLLMPDINIAATTALQSIDPLGRERALRAGANVVMPNITPAPYNASYKLYENKPQSENLRIPESEIGYDAWGDSPHFRK